MITCPYCGTSYQSFQSNCANCGGALPIPADFAADDLPVIPEQSLAVPPPTPREVPPDFIRQRILVSAWGIVGLVFTIIGTVFAVLGIIFTITLIGIFIGLPFLGLGLLMLSVGAAMLYIRYRDAQAQAELFRVGEAVQGELTRVRQNYAVQINQRHPWIISYSFQTGGSEYSAEFTTLNQAVGRLRVNKPVYVIYWPADPQRSTLYFEDIL